MSDLRLLQSRLPRPRRDYVLNKQKGFPCASRKAFLNRNQNRLLLLQKCLVAVADSLHIAAKFHLFSMMEPEDFIAHFPHLFHGVGHQNGRGAAVNDLPHLFLAFFAERAVAYGKHFIENQNIRPQQRGDGKRQTGLIPEDSCLKA